MISRVPGAVPDTKKHFPCRSKRRALDKSTPEGSQWWSPVAAARVDAGVEAGLLEVLEVEQMVLRLPGTEGVEAAAGVVVELQLILTVVVRAARDL